MAFQSLVVNCWPVEEFLPGKGYQEDASNLKLLTRDCVGEYRLIRHIDSAVDSEGQDLSEEIKKDLRDRIPIDDVVNIVNIVDTNNFSLEIGGEVIGLLHEDGYLREEREGNVENRYIWFSLVEVMMLILQNVFSKTGLKETAL